MEHRMRCSISFAYETLSVEVFSSETNWVLPVRQTVKLSHFWVTFTHPPNMLGIRTVCRKTDKGRNESEDKFDRD